MIGISFLTFVENGIILRVSDTSADKSIFDHPAKSRTKRRKKAEEPCQIPSAVSIEVYTEQVMCRNEFD